MKAFFITTPPNENDCLVAAWETLGETVGRINFEIRENPVDHLILAAAKASGADVIFYVGGDDGPGLPSVDTLRALRDIAPSIHLCWDAADGPWHPRLYEYDVHNCFDLQVSIDGAPDAPVDFATPAPLPVDAFELVDRDINAGFIGTCGKGHPRYDIIVPLEEQGLITRQVRDWSGDYRDYANFLCRCRIVVNTSFCGSGHRHHLKMRVTETARAGAALLETEGSLAPLWFPREAMYFYSTAEEAADLIRNVEDFEDRAALLARHCEEHYRPDDIYMRILEKAGL